MMKAAFRQIDISPSMPVWLNGYMTENRKFPTTEIHDAPLAGVMLLQSDQDKLLWVVLDVIAVEKDRVKPLKARLATLLDLNEDQILVSSIHSHSVAGGFSDERNFGHPLRDDYRDEVIDRLEKGLTGLNEQLVEVEPQISIGTVQGYYSKRTDITAPFDDSFTLITFNDDCERPVGALLNINCHATVVGPQNMALTSDLIGAVRTRAADQFQAPVIAFTGASGDISNRQYRQGNDFTELDRVADGIWKQIHEQLSFASLNLGLEGFTPFKWVIDYDRNEADRQEDLKIIESAQKVLNNPLATVDEKKMATTEKQVSESRLDLCHVHFEIAGKVIQFQDLTLVTFPGELACKFGLELKARKKKPNLLVAGYTDDYQGYFIEAEEYGKTYETKASLTPKGETEKVIETIEELL